MRRNQSILSDIITTHAIQLSIHLNLSNSHNLNYDIFHKFHVIFFELLLYFPLKYSTLSFLAEMHLVAKSLFQKQPVYLFLLMEVRSDLLKVRFMKQLSSKDKQYFVTFAEFIEIPKRSESRV